MTLLFKAKSGQYACIDHLSVSLYNLILNRQMLCVCPSLLFPPSRCHWASPPRLHASSCSCFLLTYSHMAFGAELQGVTLVWISRQLF